MQSQLWCCTSASRPLLRYCPVNITDPWGSSVEVSSWLQKQELLAAVGRELNLPTDDSLLAPIAALEAPSFAAAPAFQAPAPDGTGTDS